MEEIVVLYLKKDVEIDGSKFKRVLSAESVEGAEKIFQDGEIGLVVCDLEIENAKDFIKIVKREYKDFPLILIEKIPTKKYDFDFTFKMLKPVNSDGFKKKLTESEKAIVTFYEINVQEILTVSDAIEVFFQKKNYEIDEILKVTNISKEMDFEIMKNFVNTAYNNFIYIDKKIEKGGLKKIKEDFEKIQSMSKNLDRSTEKGMRELYRTIFLENHAEYKKVRKGLEQGKEKLIKFQQRIKDINDRNEIIKKELGGQLSASDKDELVKEQKGLKGKHTDIVHNVALTQEENQKLVQKLDEIEKAHVEEFQDEFEKQKDSIKGKYKVLLNKFTFYVNRQLWLEAKKSKLIMEHYEEGQVDGLINSKKYLESYIANIDKSKASDHTKKMVSYVQNFNKLNRVNIAILTTNEDFYFEYSSLIRKIESTLSTHQFMNVENFIKDFEKYNFEVVLIDCFSGILKSPKVLTILKEKLPDNLIITTYSDEKQDEKIVYKNFYPRNKSSFQKDFTMVV